MQRDATQRNKMQLYECRIHANRQIQGRWRAPNKKMELALLLVVLAARSLSAIHIRGVMPEYRDKYVPDADYQFQCIFSGEKIPFNYVNDQYCDCIDGSDEPGTSACSGVHTGPLRFYCDNSGGPPAMSAHTTAAFKTSPYGAAASSNSTAGPGKYIHFSKVDDGICDCCDGSDEVWNPYAKCSNTCVQDRKAEEDRSLENNRRLVLAKQAADALLLEARVKQQALETVIEDLELKLKRLVESALDDQEDRLDEMQGEAEGKAIANDNDKTKVDPGMQSMGSDDLDDDSNDEAETGPGWRQSQTRHDQAAIRADLHQARQQLAVFLELPEAWRALRGLTLSKSLNGQAFEITLFGKASQKTADRWHSVISIGHFSRLISPMDSMTSDDALVRREREANLGSASSQLPPRDPTAATPIGTHWLATYVNGQYCWKGGLRDLLVIFECGTVTEIRKLRETTTCHYKAWIRCPAACPSFSSEADFLHATTLLRDEL